MYEEQLELLGFIQLLRKHKVQEFRRLAGCAWR